MFAVPGWSVSSDALKAEQPGPAKGSANPGLKARKRKAAAQAVDASTVSDLWESVIEGKRSELPSQRREFHSAKRQKNKKDGKGEGKKKEEDGDAGADADAEAAAEDETPAKVKKDKKDKKKNKNKNKKQKEKQKEDASAETPSEPSTKSNAVAKPATPAAAAAAAPPPPPSIPPAAAAAAPKLTPLQASMREKLVSARFRHLNETLYTKPSGEALSIFSESPDMFAEYHEGFRRQVKVWPENPVDSFLADIRARGRARPPAKQRPGTAPLALSQTVLPRSGHGHECTIVDLGCGDARIAEALQKDGKKLKVVVKSFDLQSPSPLVVKADVADLPLADGSVNVAIFCLALMGTNWVDFVEEAYRVLHWKGELWVAEIKSRFGPVRSKHAPVTHSVGNRKKVPAKKATKNENNAAHDQDLAVEVDGMEDRRRETDVSAFVDVLKARGFVLHGDREAIDLSNKMFVKMHFVKAAAPTKGKGVKPQEAPPRGKRPIIRKIDPVDEEPEINEAAVLKPCVYKIR